MGQVSVKKSKENVDFEFQLVVSRELQLVSGHEKRKSEISIVSSLHQALTVEHGTK
jgi:hypothetical protein